MRSLDCNGEQCVFLKKAALLLDNIRFAVTSQQIDVPKYRIFHESDCFRILKH